MAKKIDMDAVIGNAIIFMGKEKLSRCQIYHYINIVDKLLPEGYYTYGDDDVFDNFCDRYSFVVELRSFGQEFLVKSDKKTLERYFRIGLPKEIIDVFQKASIILKEIIEDEKMQNSNFSDNNKQELIITTYENEPTNTQEKNFCSTESKVPVKVKINKKIRKI